MNKYFKVALEDHSEFYCLATECLYPIKHGTIIHIVSLGTYNSDLYVGYKKFWHNTWCHDIDNEMISFLDKIMVFQ